MLPCPLVCIDVHITTAREDGADVVHQVHIAQLCVSTLVYQQQTTRPSLVRYDREWTHSLQLVADALQTKMPQHGANSDGRGPRNEEPSPGQRADNEPGFATRKPDHADWPIPLPPLSSGLILGRFLGSFATDVGSPIALVRPDVLAAAVPHSIWLPSFYNIRVLVVSSTVDFAS